MITQIGGVTGRRRRDGREQEVEAKASLLPGLMSARDARDYQNEQLNLSAQALADRNRQAQEALDLEEEQAAKSNKLATAGLSSTLGMGFGDYLNQDQAEAASTAGDAATKAANALADDIETTGMGDFFSDPSAVVSDTEGWTKALGDKGSYLGLFNAPIGSQLATTVTGSKKGDWWTPAAGGAAAAAVTDAFLNPSSDFYSGILNALGGGATGAGFSFF